MSYIFALLFASAGIGLIYFVRWYARQKVVAAHEYRKATEKFYASVRPLVSDDETPAEIVDLIKYLNLTINDRRIARRLASYPLHQKWSDNYQKYNKIICEFFEARPELAQNHSDVILSWFMAVTALSPISGFAARYSIDNESMGTAAGRISRKSARNHDENNHTPHPGAVAAH